MRFQKTWLYYCLFLSGIIIYACSSKEDDKIIEKAPDKLGQEGKYIEGFRGRQATKPSEESSKTEYSEQVYTDSVLIEQLKVLSQNYEHIPFFSVIDTLQFFQVASAEVTSVDSFAFDGSIKFGLVDPIGRELLPTNFDKVYTPDNGLIGFIEVKKNGKLGLYEYKNKKLLEPQFEYFLPYLHKEKIIGFKSGSWYKVRFQDDQFEQKPVQFELIDFLEDFQYDLFEKNTGKSFSTLTKFEFYESRGVYFTPSFLERLSVQKPVLGDIIIPGEHSSFGIESRNEKVRQQKDHGGGVYSFLTDFYESGVDGRGWVLKSKNAIVYNERNKQMVHGVMLSNSQYDYTNQELNSKYLNDSIIELKTTSQNLEKGHKVPYGFWTKYVHFHVTRDGELIALKSNRTFTFTKFIHIDEGYFKGYYAHHMSNDEMEDNPGGLNLWQYDHLSMEDLDVMRNEIYADYGYKFTSEKWRLYFVKFHWYKPQFDNVDDLLTPIDKHNIKLILEVKEKLKNGSIKRNKTAGVFYAAG